MVDLDTLDQWEREWLEDYRRECACRLEPDLSAEEGAELRRMPG
jgi:hypothetical protein